MKIEKDIFTELSSPALLERCLRGASQNQNESLDSKLWLHQSKVKFAGMKRVTFVTQLTILDHNFGYVENRFLQYLGFSDTDNSLLSKKRMDMKKTTPRRKIKKRNVTKPGPDYQPGGF